MSASKHSKLIKERIHANYFDEKAYNPLGLDETCKLISKRREEKYIFEYDPSETLKMLKSFGYNDEHLSIFDQQKRKGCCNVISITLYIIYNNSVKDLEKFKNYILSIQKSIKNVEKCLSKWIVRLYFDKSVYKIFNIDLDSIEPMASIKRKEYIIKLKVIIEDALNYIFNSDNVEIYTYKCSSISRRNIQKVRTYRFLSLSDPQVNFCVIREADGIVSALDCHNIKIFTKYKKQLFYIPEVTGKYNIWNKLPTEYILAYSNWLKLYKNINSYFFDKNINMYDLLAGTFMCRLKIRRDVYFQHCNSVIKEVELYKRENLISMFDISSLDTGYDEMVLLSIFKNIISVPKNLTIDEISSHVDNLFCADNILLIDIYSEIMEFQKTNNVNDLITKLVEKNVLNSYPRSIPKIVRRYDYKDRFAGYYEFIAYDIGFFIDNILLNNKIKRKDLFNIYIGYVGGSYSDDSYTMMSHINIPYSEEYNIYDTV